MEESLPGLHYRKWWYVQQVFKLVCVEYFTHIVNFPDPRPRPTTVDDGGLTIIAGRKAGPILSISEKKQPQ